MSEPGKILVVDDTPVNVKLLADLLRARGYEVATAEGGPPALELVAGWRPDLVLLDIIMPGMSGYEVCERIRADPATEMLPIVLVTALDAEGEVVKGLEAGADDFLTKPVRQGELLARVRSLLRIKTLYDRVEAQAGELARWNETLETRVRSQVEELERMARLKRFLSPQVAELIVSRGEQSRLEGHRQRIATLFCDLRGFTPFSETAEPEDVMAVLQEYHQAMGELIHAHAGTIDHRAGDGIMVVFNDPLPCEDPAAAAVRLAVAMRERMGDLAARWRKQGHELGFGVGISLGYATLGMVGFEGRYDYSANGSVVNQAARLSDEADDGEILISQRAYAALEDRIEAEPVGELALKGFHQPVGTYRVLRMR